MTLCNDTTSQQRCVNVAYDTTLPQLRCNVVVTLCVSWVLPALDNGGNCLAVYLDLSLKAFDTIDICNLARSAAIAFAVAVQKGSYHI